MFDSIRQTSKRMSADQVLFGQQTLSEMIAVSLAARRFLMVLLVSFAALAMLLSVVGIYGVISYLVARRTPEIGIRMALGADRARVMRLVLGDGLRLALIGVGAGIVAALGLTRLMNKWLFGISAADPVTYATLSILLLLVAGLACGLPARRAMKVDPLITLRYD